MRIIIYSRVSTDEERQSPERQLLKCQEYCRLHDHTIIETIQEWHTGNSYIFSRPKGKKILDLIKKGQVDAIIVFSMDRFSREYPTKIIKQLQRLRDMGVKFVSVTEPMFNLEDNEIADLIIFISGWFNNWFLKKLRRDIKSGLEKARAKGVILGRRPLKLDTNKVRELNKQGLSLRQIAKQMSISHVTVMKVLKNPPSKIAPSSDKAKT